MKQLLAILIAVGFAVVAGCAESPTIIGESTEEPKDPERPKDVAKVFIRPDVDSSVERAARSAAAYWSEIAEVELEFVLDIAQATVIVDSTKTWDGHHDITGDLVKTATIPQGDEACHDQWLAYSDDYVETIARHLFGHVFGSPDAQGTMSVMDAAHVRDSVEYAEKCVDPDVRFDVYIEAIPEYATALGEEDIRAAIIAGVGTWTGRTDAPIRFVETASQANVQWGFVKDWGGHALGDTTNVQGGEGDDYFVKMGLGDTLCATKWHQYDGPTIRWVAEHQFGHVLGYGHANDESDPMYPTNASRVRYAEFCVQSVSRDTIPTRDTVTHVIDFPKADEAEIVILSHNDDTFSYCVSDDAAPDGEHCFEDLHRSDKWRGSVDPGTTTVKVTCTNYYEDCDLEILVHAHHRVIE